MSALSQKLKNHFYGDEEHPYALVEDATRYFARPYDRILDAERGRSAPVLRKFKNIDGSLVGVDLVDPRDVSVGVEYYNADLRSISIPSSSVDLVISRSVFEHLTGTDGIYKEMYRVLKSGGRLVFSEN